MKRSIEAAYALVDPACVFDGLFVPTNGIKPMRIKEYDPVSKSDVLRLLRPNLMVPARKFGSSSISFSGPERLGAGDQSVFLAVCAQAGIDGLTVSHNTGGQISMELRANLKLGGTMEQRNVCKIRTTLTSLARDAGYSDPKGKTSSIYESLHRLRSTQIREVTADADDSVSYLIATRFNRESGETHIAVNPRQCTAITGGQFVRISLSERRKLTTEPAKIVHAWLCANIRLGQPLGNGNGAKIDTLLPHVWGPMEPAVTSRQVISKRRGQLIEALHEIRECTKYDPTRCNGEDLAWEFDISGQLVQITRAKQLPIYDRIPALKMLEPTPHRVILGVDMSDVKAA